MKIKNGDGITKYIQTARTGTEADAYISVHVDINKVSINLGLIDAYSTATVLGTCTAPDTAKQTLGTTAGLYVYPSTALAMTVVSDDVTDDGAGLGAQTVLIKGLNDSYGSIEETVTLDGTTPVACVNSYFRINTVQVQTAGSGGTNTGTITVENAGTVYSTVQPGAGTAYPGVYTTPADVSALCTDCTVSCIGGSTTADIVLRTDTAAAIVQHRVLVSECVQLDTAITVPPKTDIEVQSTASIAGTAATVSLELILQDQ